MVAKRLSRAIEYELGTNAKLLFEIECKPTIIVKIIKVYSPKLVKLILKLPKIGAEKLNNENVSN